jgi:diguanylate cyclase (GGDEF)-like protein/PAS domain S-box-containing protein
MLSKHAYQILVIACPAIALAAGAMLLAHYPEFIWYSGSGIVATLGLVLYVAHPSNLKERLRQFELVFNNAANGTIVLDLSGNVRWFNRILSEGLEKQPGEIVGQPLNSLLEGDAWAVVQAQRRNLLDDEPVRVEGHVCWNTEQISVTGVATLIRDEASRPDFILLQLQNLITPADLDGAGATVESRLQQALDLTSDAVISLDARGRVIRANTRANELFAANDQSSLLGGSIIEFISTDDVRGFVASYNESKAEPGVSISLGNVNVVPGGRRHKAPAAARERTLNVRLISLSGNVASTTLVCQDVTSEHQSTSRLRSSEARFSRIFHTSPDAILLVRHQDSVILDFNQGFTRLLGYAREDAIGLAENEMGLFADPEVRTQLVDLLQQTGECNEVEARLRSRTGKILTVEVSLRYVEIDGELCTMCIGRDISPRIAAERARRESEAKFSRIFSESPDGILIVRQNDLTVYDVNEAFLNTSGYEREELVDQGVVTLSGIIDREAFNEAIKGFNAEGRLLNEEMPLRTKTGEFIPTLVSATRIELHGEACALCITKDIQDLRETEQRLKDSESRFRGAFENAPIGIMLVDADGKIFEANRFAADLLAYDLKSLEGRHISRLIPAEERGQFKETMDRLFSGTDDTLRSEKRMLCNDGLEIWTNFHIGMQRAGRASDDSYGIVQFTDVTEMKNSQRRIERMAFYDTLTDLANRRLFYDRLGHAVSHATRSGTLAALLYLDLDQFKRVNDTLGHEMGDVLLQEVATRLSHCVRQVDTVGRPGGDEFTILLTDIKTPSDAGYVAEKILETLAKPINISGHQLVITTSIGITIIPDDGTESNALMKNADLAMYRAKEHGRNNYQYYSEEMNTNAVHRLRLEYEMRRALERQEFVLYYQPKIRLTDQQVTGVECLIRWQHPERGLLSPVEFIDVAEETGAIVDIGSWVIAEACRAGRAMVKQTGREFEIAINISPRQFKDPNLVNNIRKALRETGLNPSTLEVEITETMLMGDIEAANQTVQRLHELGVKLAIDDFGTGYSSLNYLKKFPIDTVKVDRSFIMDIPVSSDDMAITSAVIAMAHRLNMAVVAEGVETREQLEFLQEHGCEYAQGYLFSKPLPLSNVKSMLLPNVRLLRGR